MKPVSKLSKIMNDFERQRGLFCTPPHIVRGLLDREEFPGPVRALVLRGDATNLRRAGGADRRPAWSPPMAN